MAATNNGNTAHTIIPAPIATNEQHICFICLHTDSDTPNAVWVDPCPCSLEAHEGCMLRYIAEMETTRRRSNRTPLACPACKAPFVIEEPRDAFLAVRDNLYRRYSRASPIMLALFIASGSFAGALWYGGSSVAIFAGHDTFIRWLEGGGRQRLPSTLIKMAALSAIGPSLLVFRWLPSLGTIVLLPFSVLVSPFSNLYLGMPILLMTISCVVWRNSCRPGQSSVMASLTAVGRDAHATRATQLCLPLA
jgi:hypothetical protein